MKVEVGGHYLRAVIIFTKFHDYMKKIVDLLLMAIVWTCFVFLTRIFIWTLNLRKSFSFPNVGLYKAIAHRIFSKFHYPCISGVDGPIEVRASNLSYKFLRIRVLSTPGMGKI